MSRGIAFAVLIGCIATANGQSFVNWETPHVQPVDITPDRSTLLVVNLPDNRLEVFDITSGTAVAVGSVPVGLDPVSVRARSDTEAWVINQISDTVSIVDLATLHVVATLDTADEPADVVFAGTPERAFVSCSQANRVLVYDPNNPLAPPIELPIEGEDPRALATDGDRVYAAIFESGNGTTVLSETVVSSPVNPYPGDPNPPPNHGSDFDPPLAPGLSTPPETSLIVKRNAAGVWEDDNAGDWSAAVGWGLHDHDVAIIDANALIVTYAVGLMNHNMALAVHAGGDVTVVGTDALNHVRFEPKLSGRFVRVNVAGFDPLNPGAGANVSDLNPHLDYLSSSVSQTLRDQSIGDPRAIVWNDSGTRGYVAGMGSNNVVVVDPGFGRLAAIEVGQGPTGLALDEGRERLYAVNKFEATISVIDTASDSVMDVVAFHDPTPQVIRLGRPHLYDTQKTSGLGHASCASCHVDGRMDNLSWDLGDPTGSVKTFDQSCAFGLGTCEDWHPMKGPMATQTLVGIISTEPFHWRGDRADFAAFNIAFENLLGDDEQLTPEELDEFMDFVDTLTFPPNPFRNIDSTLPTVFPNGGDPANGFAIFTTGQAVGFINCVDCHTLPTGAVGEIIPASALMEAQQMKVPQLRNMYEKTGFDQSSMTNNRGFGYVHDGNVATLFDFLQFPGFTFASDQDRLDVAAYLMCFATDTHAAVGRQTTLTDAATADPDQLLSIDGMVSLADDGGVGLVVKGRQEGRTRGYTYIGAETFQSDVAAETVSASDLASLASPGSELTYTLVPAGSEIRIGIDRDEDSFYDGDEVAACSDPAHAASTPGSVVKGDSTGDGLVTLADFADFNQCFDGPNAAKDRSCTCPFDYDADNDVDVVDFAGFQRSFDTP